MEVKKYIRKCIFLTFIFQSSISTNNVIRSLKFSMYVCNIAVEGTVSQIFILNLCSYFI